MSSRSYWVGLPVGITVKDDGTVTFEVDTSEAESSIAEAYHENGENMTDDEDSEFSEDRMILDVAIVSGHAYGATTVKPASDLGEMTCPVRYACGFKTSDLQAMAMHVLQPEHGA